MNFVSLPTSNEGTCRRQLVGIASVSLVEEFSLIFTGTNGQDVEMFVARERTSPILSTLPIRSVSTGAQEARQPLVGLGLPCLRKIYVNRPCGNRPNISKYALTSWNYSIHLGTMTERSI